MAFLTILGSWQPVATRGKRIGLIMRFPGSKRTSCLRPVAPPFSKSFPCITPTRDRLGFG
jgi:hypothetical protein